MKVDKTGLAEYLRKEHPWPGGIIFSEEYKFIFMRAGKIGGTSIVSHFLKREVKDLVLREEQYDKHNEWLYSLTDSVLKDFFIFSVVRNPYDRFVSAAKYLSVDVDDLALNFRKHCEDEKVYGHTLPLHFYTHNKGVCFVDFIARMESLNEDMNLVCDWLKLPRRVLPKTNYTKRGHYVDHYTAVSRKFVTDYYSLDILYYGYVYGISEKVKPIKGNLIRQLIAKIGV